MGKAVSIERIQHPVGDLPELPQDATAAAEKQ
jgi:hypothetical protein